MSNDIHIKDVIRAFSTLGLEIETNPRISDSTIAISRILNLVAILSRGPMCECVREAFLNGYSTKYVLDCGIESPEPNQTPFPYLVANPT